MVTSSLADNAPSSAARRRTYEPGSEKLAVVSIAPASPNVTVPGPLTFTQLVATAGMPSSGKSSSVTVPSSEAGAGRVIVWSSPAFTAGALFSGGGGGGGGGGGFSG